MKHFDPRKIKGALVRAGIATKESILGCPTPELRTLEKQLGIRLPRAYKEFLRMLGHGAGDFASDCMWKYRDIPAIQLIAQESSNGCFVSKGDSNRNETCFAFFVLQEEFFLFFYTNQGHDPPVWNSDSEKPYFPSFSSWLWTSIDEEVVWHQLKKRRSLGAAIITSE